MRIIDLISPYLHGVRRVVDLSSGTVSVEQYLHLHHWPDIRYARGDADEEQYSPGDLVVLATGLARDSYGDPGVAHSALRRLDVGARALVLFEQAGGDLPYHRILDTLVAQRCQVLQVASIDLRVARTGVVIERVDRPGLPRSYYGEPVPTSDAEFEAARLRLVNEYVFHDYVSRAIRARLLVIEAEQGDARARVEEARATRPRMERLQQENGELTRALRAVEADLARAERRISQLDSSAPMRIGRVLVDAARHPLRGSVRAPRELYHAWRTRSRGRAPAAPAPRRAVTRRGQEQSRHLARNALALGPRDRLVVAGVIREDTAAALSPDCVVNVLSPNDAALVVERGDPDIVIIEAAATRAGQPWAYAGTPFAPERDRALLDVVVAANAIGRPVVLWRNMAHQEAPGLLRIGERCDLVLHTDDDSLGGRIWSRGVQLAVHNPIAADVARAPEPVHVSGWGRVEAYGHRQTVTRALESLLPLRPQLYLDPLDPGGILAIPTALRHAVAGALEWRRSADRYRAAAIAVADPFGCRDGYPPSDRVLEQLACGARVLSGPHAGLGGPLAEVVTVVTEPASAAPAVRAAVEAGPLGNAALWPVLRELFTRHATPVRLHHLTRALGLGSDPLDDRRVSVVATLDDSEGAALPGPAVQASALAEAVIAQAHRPVEVVVPCPGDGATAVALTEIEEAGIRVVTVRGDRRWARLIEHASAPWVAPWLPSPTVDSWAENHLLDLIVGGEMSRADAVGYASKESMAFTTSLMFDAAIVRRTAVASYGVPSRAVDVWPLEGWSRRGARLFAVDST